MKICNRCSEEKALVDFALHRRRLVCGEVREYRRAYCKVCDSKSAVARTKVLKLKIGSSAHYEQRCAWMEKKYGSVENYKRIDRRKLGDKYEAAGLTRAGTIRKQNLTSIIERRWDRLAAQNARQAFDYWFRVRATDEQIAAWFAGAGRPWANPRLSDAEKYAIRYRLDPVFAAKEKQRASDKRFRFPERAAMWAKDGTRWYRAAETADGTVTIDALRYMRRIPECAYCGEEIRDDERHIDHITPLAGGGRHSDDNLLPAHGRCNLRKSDTPLLPFMFPEVFRPRGALHG